MIDVANIKINAGNGGDGAVSFRREKYISKGGPDGGDGGNGGSVYLVADHNLSSLMDFRSRPVFEAQSGRPGQKKKRSGESGSDLYVKVPLGTLVYNLKDGKEVLIQDMSHDGEVFLVCEGGVGGRGNYRFKSSVNQTPYQYTPGTKGEYKEVKLEVKLFADVGLIGMPNAGKSTLINRLTKSNAKVASYAFTTLSPNLGVSKLAAGKEAVLADIPGLIEGASEGKGLGDEFLRHVERTRVLVHIIDPFLYSSDGSKNHTVNAIDNYKIIRGELMTYGHGLAEKKEIVLINKIDLTEVKESFEDIKQAFKKIGIEVLGISAATGEGISALKLKMSQVLDQVEKQPAFTVQKPTKYYTEETLPNKRMVRGRVRKML